MAKKGKLTNCIKRRIKKLKNNNTCEQYERHAMKFVEWVKDAYGTERFASSEHIRLAQEYADYLDYAKGLLPDSIHTYMSGVTQSLGLSLKDLDLPKRGRPSKGRNHNDSSNCWEVASYIGIRKAEYQRLKGGDLVERDGRLWVTVEKGKGGKRQSQLILQQHEQSVMDFFKGKEPGEYLLSKDDADRLKDAQTHAARRALAREAYDYYANHATRSEKDALLEECHERFRHKYDRKYKDHPKKGYRLGEEMWIKEMNLIKNKPKRYCRGNNRRALEAQGRPIYFDREAVLLVSVLHLAHYREDVTVDNYLI